MVIYLDIIFLINFIIDFALLLTVNIALKRYSHISKLLLSSLLGSISLLSLFINIPKLLLFLLKVILALFMVLIAFGYKNIKYTLSNIIYFYMVSIILGGFLYFLKIEFSYQNHGLVFYYHGLTINYLFILLLAPFILYVFIKSLNILKEIKNYYYKITIFFDSTTSLTIPAFLDTGNKLKDPITNKPIILLNKKLIKGKYNIRSPMYIPYNSLNHHSLLECFKPEKIYLNNQELKNYLIGLSETSFKLNGIECLLNYQILEDI